MFNVDGPQPFDWRRMRFNCISLKFPASNTTMINNRIISLHNDQIDWITIDTSTFLLSSIQSIYSFRQIYLRRHLLFLFFAGFFIDFCPFNIFEKKFFESEKCSSIDLVPLLMDLPCRCIDSSSTTSIIDWSRTKIEDVLFFFCCRSNSIKNFKRRRGEMDRVTLSMEWLIRWNQTASVAVEDKEKFIDYAMRGEQMHCKNSSILFLEYFREGSVFSHFHRSKLFQCRRNSVNDSVHCSFSLVYYLYRP